MTVYHDRVVRSSGTRTRVSDCEDEHEDGAHYFTISCEHATELHRNVSRSTAIDLAKRPADWCDQCGGKPKATTLSAPAVRVAELNATLTPATVVSEWRRGVTWPLRLLVNDEVVWRGNNFSALLEEVKCRNLKVTDVQRIGEPEQPAEMAS